VLQAQSKFHPNYKRELLRDLRKSVGHGDGREKTRILHPQPPCVLE
jgi:hypothetical protein